MYENAWRHNTENWKYDGESKCHRYCTRCGTELDSHTSQRTSDRDSNGVGRDYCKICGATMANFNGW